MKAVLFPFFLGSFLLLGACAPAGVAAPKETETMSSFPVIPFSSPAFTAGGAIPAHYTCSGNGVSPALEWGAPPGDTKTFALTLADPDAPSGTFTHWVIYNIPAASRGLAEAVAPGAQLADGSLQGMNSAGQQGYTGPCPPSGTPHYTFVLYALDTVLTLGPGATRDDIVSAVQGHILAMAQLVGTYTR